MRQRKCSVIYLYCSWNGCLVLHETIGRLTGGLGGERSGFRSGLDALHFGERDGHLALSRSGRAGDGLDRCLDLGESLFEALLQTELFFGAALRAGGQQQPHRHPAAAHAEQHGAGQLTGVQGPVEAHRTAVHEQQLVFSERFESRRRGVAHQQHR